DHAVDHRRLDALALSRQLTRTQRVDDAIGAIEPGDEVRDRSTRAHRCAVLLAGRRHEARHGLGDEVERWPVRVRAGRAVAVDGGHYQSRVDLIEARLAE